MRLRRENILWNVLMGTGVYLLDSLRDRLNEGVGDFTDRARDTYAEASRRAVRAREALYGEDHGMSTGLALLLGVGVGVGVGMLLAPATGEETRGTISSKVHDLGNRMRDRFAEQRREAGGANYGT
jgi:hypothetical protein